jgi:hypothetical protein
MSRTAPEARGAWDRLPTPPTGYIPSGWRAGYPAANGLFSPSTIDETKIGVNRANCHNWSYGIAPVAISVKSASFSGLTSRPKGFPGRGSGQSHDRKGVVFHDGKNCAAGEPSPACTRVTGIAH